MWVSEDGRMIIAAIPTEYIWDLPGVREFAPDLPAFADWDYDREGGPVDELLAEAERDFIGASPAEEDAFRAEAVPDDMIVRFPWAEITDPASAEAALQDVPVRWRLDIQSVLESLVWDLASPST
jgi:hypothetical protein